MLKRLQYALSASAIILLTASCADTELLEDLPTPCDPNPCQNSGTCDVENDNAVCACTDGFSGDRCETPDENPCEPNPCQNGTCQNYGTAPICHCDFGWAGELCDEWKDHCDPNPCLSGGTCTQYGAGAFFYSCDCPHPYNGEHCENCGDLCESRPDYYRDRFISCITYEQRPDCASDPQSPSCYETCRSWMGCNGEIEINAYGYGTIVGNGYPECLGE